MTGQGSAGTLVRSHGTHRPTALGVQEDQEMATMNNSGSGSAKDRAAAPAGGRNPGQPAVCSGDHTGFLHCLPENLYLPRHGGWQTSKMPGWTFSAGPRKRRRFGSARLRDACRPVVREQPSWPRQPTGKPQSARACFRRWGCAAPAGGGHRDSALVFGNRCARRR